MSVHARKTHNGIGSEQSESHDGLGLDCTFTLLSNSRRRAIIRAMVDHENMSKNELIWIVAENEYQMPREQIGSSERHTIYVSLSQTHLPKLEDSGIIKMDRDRITVGDNMCDLVRFLETENSLGQKVRSLLF